MRLVRSHHRAVLLLFILLPLPSFAWGPEGHEIIADIARERLTPATRRHVTELLGNDDLAAISVWADDIKHERPETFAWHFVDIPMNAARFSEPRDCYRPEEKYPTSLQDHHNCVVDRITMFEEVLADRNVSRQERIEALKFVVHFVGDVHQPLHAIGEARGGNDIHVVEFGSGQCGKYVCNLHYAWDIGLIDHTGLTETQYVRKINQIIARQKPTAASQGSPEEWANESFGLAKKAWLKDGAAVDERYYRNNIAIINSRLEFAGLRLAAILNQALGSHNPSHAAKR